MFNHIINIHHHHHHHHQPINYIKLNAIVLFFLLLLFEERLVGCNKIIFNSMGVPKQFTV